MSASNAAVDRKIGRLQLRGMIHPIHPPAAVLPVLLAVTAVLLLWDLPARAGIDPYYEAAVYSGTKSWSAFFFGSLDQSGFITIDKPAPCLWLPELSAKIFGINAWSLLLPQIVLFLVALAVLHRTIRQCFGEAAAAFAVVGFVSTPVLLPLLRSNKPDGQMLALLVLAACGVSAAMRSGRLRPLMWAAVALGAAFNMKMLQAFLVLPGLVLAYLWSAPDSVRRRAARLSAAGALLLLVSGAWATAVDLTPKTGRPYVSGSTDDTVRQLVFGYNGASRLLGGGSSTGGLTGALQTALQHMTQTGAAGSSGQLSGSTGGAVDLSGGGWTRLLSLDVASQYAWLLPLAIVGLCVGLALVRRTPRTDQRRAQMLLWGGWLVVQFVVLSLAKGLWEAYYTAPLAPAIGVLAGTGIVALWQLYRRSRRWAWTLPATLAGSAAWCVVLLRRSPDFAPWFTWTVAGVTAAGVLILLTAAYGGAVGRLPPRTRITAATALVLIAAFLPTAVFEGSTLVAPATPLAAELPVAGPDGAQLAVGTGRLVQLINGFLASALVGPDQRLVDYLETRQSGTDWLAATVGGLGAAPLILRTGRPVMDLGGFTGADPYPSTAQLAADVSAGKLRYVLLDPAAAGMGVPQPAGVAAWVSGHCAAVPASAYGAAGRQTAGTAVLYDCRPATSAKS